MQHIEQSQLRRVFAFQLMDLNASEPGPFRHRNPVEQTYRSPGDAAPSSVAAASDRERVTSG